MTIQDYENQNGFKEELAIVRSIGMGITTLEESIPARPHRQPERIALRHLRLALEDLRDEIGITRNVQ